MNTPWEVWIVDTATYTAVTDDYSNVKPEEAPYTRHFLNSSLTCGECSKSGAFSEDYAPDCPHNWGYDDQSEVGPHHECPACMVFEPRK